MRGGGFSWHNPSRWTFIFTLQARKLFIVNLLKIDKGRKKSKLGATKISPFSTGRCFKSSNFLPHFHFADYSLNQIQLQWDKQPLDFVEGHRRFVLYSFHFLLLLLKNMTASFICTLENLFFPISLLTKKVENGRLDKARNKAWQAKKIYI